MFTGIIEHYGVVESLDSTPSGGRIRIRAPQLAPSLEVAGSIAVNGCCLTVVEHDQGIFAADLSPETLRRTMLGDMKPKTRVNLERPLTAGKELGGHFVQGHVDGVGRVVRLAPEGENDSAPMDQNWWLEVSVPSELGCYVAEKGSITVDGISLTVASWRDGIAGFAIIPYTYSHTNLSALKPGDGVNLEADVLAKYIERLLDARRANSAPGLSIERLKEEGF